MRDAYLSFSLTTASCRIKLDFKLTELMCWTLTHGHYHDDESIFGENHGQARERRYHDDHHEVL